MNAIGAQGRWYKLIDDRRFVLDLHDDGTLTEHLDGNPSETWDGRWEAIGAAKAKHRIDFQIGTYKTHVEGNYWGGTFYGHEDGTKPVVMSR